MSSLGFILLMTIIFGITGGGFDLSIAFLVLAISFGFFPATIVASLLGLVSGFIYFVLQDQITTGNRSQILSLLLSLGLAASALTYWSAFF